MKYESRRYNKNETGKEFYLRRKKEMNEILESDAWKTWQKKIWAEYKAAQKKVIPSPWLFPELCYIVVYEKHSETLLSELRNILAHHH